MIKIFLPNTPSYFMGEAKVLKAKKVLVSCGGGMGGKSWDEYIVDFPNGFTEGFLDVIDYKGNKIKLNTRYIVKISDSQIVRITTDSENPTYFGINTYYYETPVDDDVVLCSEYGKTETKNIKLISRAEEIL